MQRIFPLRHARFLTLIAIFINIAAFTSPQPPLLRSVPPTSFSCQGRPAGYYADPEAACQAYHMCDILEQKYSYLCPGFTLFNQKYMVCDHWHAVNCAIATQYYDLNKKIGQVPEHNRIRDDGRTSPKPKLSSIFKINQRTTTQAIILEGDRLHSENTLRESRSQINRALRKTTTIPEVPDPKSDTNFTIPFLHTTTSFTQIPGTPTEKPIRGNDAEITALRLAFQTVHKVSLTPDPIQDRIRNETSTGTLKPFRELILSDTLELPALPPQLQTELLPPPEDVPFQTVVKLFPESHVDLFPQPEVELIVPHLKVELPPQPEVELLPPHPETDVIPQPPHSHILTEKQIQEHNVKGVPVNPRGSGLRVKFGPVEPISEEITTDGIKLRPLLKRSKRPPLFDERNFTVSPNAFTTPVPIREDDNDISEDEISDPFFDPIIPFLMPPFVDEPIQSSKTSSASLPTLSPFLIPPPKGPVILQGGNQEIRTPLVVTRVGPPRTDPRSFPAPQSQALDFFIPAPGLLPPLPDNALRDEDNSEDDHAAHKPRMTMTFPNTTSIRRRRPLRANPNCPRCHPAFLKENSCQPCVIIK